MRGRRKFVELCKASVRGRRKFVALCKASVRGGGSLLHCVKLV